MELKDFASTFRLIKYQFRTGRREQAYTTLALLSFAAAGGFASAPKEAVLGVNLGQIARYAEVIAFLLGVAFLAALALRIWKQAVVVQRPGGPPTEAPTAIKGLNSFTEADGELFAQLGRPTELQRLLAIARDDQIGLCAVRGQSGAGKTSLLRAGLAFNLGKERSVYWEAVPSAAADALLHAISIRFPVVASLDSLPAAFPDRCVLILDQFEQLSEKDPAHQGIFALLARIAKAPAPHLLSAVVGFRREFAPDWLDFEQHCNFRAEQVPVNLLSPSAAGEALTVLASESGFTLDQALVNNFIGVVTTADGVSPVEIAIGLLGLANFVQQRGFNHVNNADFATSGGAEGLLLSFAREKLDEIPDQLRSPLLTGMVLTLVDPSNDRRVAEGATAAEIAAQAKVPESLLAPYIERLTHPRVRLLEKFNGERFRLPHERLVPVLRRLAGVILAEQDRVRILFEGEFARWIETKSRSHLLSGKDLRNATAFRQSLVQGQSAAQKARYLSASVRRRTWRRIAISGAVIALGAVSLLAARWADAWIQRDRLLSWGLSPRLFEGQYEADSIGIDSGVTVTDVEWLRARRLSGLSLSFAGSSLAPLHRLTGLTSLTLDLRRSQVKDLTGLDKLTGLTSLTLDLRSSRVKDLTGLDKLTGLTSLTLDLTYSQVKDLTGLDKLTGLTSLTLDLTDSQVKDLTGLDNLTHLTSLTLRLSVSQVKDLTGLDNLTHLTSLTLHLGRSEVKDLTGLDKLTGLTSLTLDLTDSQVKDLTGLDKLTGLTSLTLDLRRSQVKDLTGLDKLTGLTSLTLDLTDSQVKDLTGLDKLTGLTSLTLDLRSSQVKDLTGLDKLTRLTSLTLDLRSSQVKNLTGLDKLTGLTSLTLDLTDSQVKDLTRLDKLTRLTSLTLDLRGSQMMDLTGLDKLTGLTSLTLDLTGSQVKDLTGLDKLTGLTSLTLDLSVSQVKDLTGLDKLTGLTSLTLDLRSSQVKDLTGLDKLTRLTSLTLDLSGSDVKDLTGLDKLTGLTSLTLDLSGSDVKDMTGLDKLTGLTSLTLDLRRSQVKDLTGLDKLTGLTSLKLIAPVQLVTTFPGNEKILRSTEISLWFTSNDRTVKIPSGFKSVSLHE